MSKAPTDERRETNRTGLNRTDFDRISVRVLTDTERRCETEVKRETN
jgi:hypothetical protein